MLAHKQQVPGQRRQRKTKGGGYILRKERRRRQGTSAGIHPEKGTVSKHMEYRMDYTTKGSIVIVKERIKKRGYLATGTTKHDVEISKHEFDVVSRPRKGLRSWNRLSGSDQ